MNETEKITESKNEAEITEIKKSDFPHLIVAMLNLIIIIISFTQLSNITIFSYLFGVIFIGILSIGAIILILKKNPYYMYLCYGSIFCGFLGAINLVGDNLFLLILLLLLLIPEVPYIFTSFTNMAYGMVDAPYSYLRTNQANLIRETRRRDFKEYKKTELRKELRKKFKPNLIALVSFCCSLGLILTIIFST